MHEAIVECAMCDKRWVCCRALRVELLDDEKEKYQCEQALRDRKDINIIAQHNGRCVYFNPRTRKCTIWKDRPRVCRIYDCKKDPRVAEIIGRDLLAPLDEGGSCRVVVSIAVLEEKDERKVSPMMIYSKHGPTATETFEVKGRGEQVIEMTKKMLDRQLRTLLGDSGEDKNADDKV